MSILPTRAAPSKSAGFPHDPNFCGIDPATDCDACRARAERDCFEHDAEAKERARLRAIGKRFAKATGITIDDLRDALLPALAEPVAEIASAVMDEREAA